MLLFPYALNYFKKSNYCINLLSFSFYILHCIIAKCMYIKTLYVAVLFQLYIHVNVHSTAEHAFEDPQP